MAIRRKGEMIQCPKSRCRSQDLLVIEVPEEEDYNITECQSCGEKFLTGLPIIEGQEDVWNHPENTAYWHHERI